MKTGRLSRIIHILVFLLLAGALEILQGAPANADSGHNAMKISSSMSPVEGNWEIGGTIGVSKLNNCTLSMYIASRRQALVSRNLQSRGKRGAFLISRTSGLLVDGAWGETFQSISEQPSEIPVYVRARLVCRADGGAQEFISRNVVSVDFSNQTDQVVTLEAFARHLREHVDKSG
jgi:hypothetical protein